MKCYMIAKILDNDIYGIHKFVCFYVNTYTIMLIHFDNNPGCRH